MKTFRKSILGAALIAIGTGITPFIPNLQAEQSDSVFADWWTGKTATGNWFGIRNTLEDNGVDFRVAWRANFLAIVDGGLQQRGGFDQEINFDANVDLAKLTKWEALDGLSFTGNIRWRESTYSINQYSGTDSTFRPSAYTGGSGWRFRKFYLTYETPELFGIPEFLTLSAGWQVPTDLFLVQPESKLFVNQTIRTAKGINPNLPWGGSFSTWGGFLKVKPTEWFYLQSGMYLAYPFGTDPLNHALSFEGYQIDPSLNGIYTINEVGFTPTIGAAKLPGKYAAGFIYWGVEKSGFDRVPYDGNLQFYGQADQQLTREVSPDPEPSTATADGKSFKTPVSAAKPAKLNPQGLYFFSTINFAPPANNALPFYTLTGFVYKGLIPTRDNDQTGIAFAYGSYSFDAAQQDRARNVDPRSYQAVLEIDYRFQVNKWAYVQPTFQYIIRPGGRGNIENDTILGLHLGANF